MADHPGSEIADAVRVVMLAAFGDIAGKTGLNPTYLDTHLDMRLGHGQWATVLWIEGATEPSLQTLVRELPRGSFNHEKGVVGQQRRLSVGI